MAKKAKRKVFVSVPVDDSLGEIDTIELRGFRWEGFHRVRKMTKCTLNAFVSFVLVVLTMVFNIFIWNLKRCGSNIDT